VKGSAKLHLKHGKPFAEKHLETKHPEVMKKRKRVGQGRRKQAIIPKTGNKS
jgi:hypothetical protein